MGVVFYHILTGKPLFEGLYRTLRDFLTVNKFCDLSHVPERLKNSCRGARMVTTKMLSINPKIRPTSEELLSLSWICDFNFSMGAVDE